MSFIERLAPSKINPRILWWVIVLVIVTGLLLPIELPLVVNQSTMKAYRVVDNLPKGSVVILSLDVSAAVYPAESEAQGQVILRHLFRRGARVVLLGIGIADATTITLRAIRSAEASGIIPPESKYGTDYVCVGFIPGGELAAAALATNFKNIVKADCYGTPAEKLPILQGIRDYRDVALLVDVDTAGMYVYYLRHWTVAQHTPTIVMPGMQLYPDTVTYYNAGQFVGLVAGLRGAAEYEKMLGVPAYGMKSMITQSLAHVTILVLIGIGNVCEIRRRSKK